MRNCDLQPLRKSVINLLTKKISLLGMRKSYYLLDLDETWIRLSRRSSSDHKVLRTGWLLANLLACRIAKPHC